MSTNKFGGISVETVAGSPAPDKRLMIDETGDEQARQMLEQRARYADYWKLRNREKTRNITLETMSWSGLIRTINELENQVMSERANGEYWERAGREARAYARGIAEQLDKQASEIEHLKTGVVHYADVGGVPIYESLEGREARHKSELERLNGLVRIANSDKHEAERANGSLGKELAYARKKIDDLKRQKDAIHERLSWYEKYRTEPSDELDKTRIRAENAERACETLAAKLKAAEQERDKAQADARRTGNHGGGHVTVLPVVTLPADWMVQATADAKAVDTLKAELGAALHRATRAERKAADANLTNEELRKALMDIANECDEQETRPWLMIGRIFAMATKALDSKKANG